METEVFRGALMNVRTWSWATLLRKEVGHNPLTSTSGSDE